MFYQIDGTALVPYGTPFTVANLDNSITVQGKTGGGPLPGAYTVLIDGDIGDTIRIELGSWSKEFELKGDMEIDFKTRFTPEIHFLSKPRYRLPYLIMILLLIALAATVVHYRFFSKR